MVVMGLQVIGAGFARTGTTSLKAALEALGRGPCYHMFDVMSDPERVRRWLDIARGAAPRWDEVFAGYASAVDWPVAAYWRQLATAYPDAKVVLTVRDPDRWYDSVSGTIFKQRLKPRGLARTGARVAAAVSPDLRAFLAMTRETVEQPLFDDRLADREHMTAAFVEHLERVRATIPAERLLTYRVADGWPPLCEFLGVPVPEQAFPHDNRRDDFSRLAGPQFARLAFGPLLRVLPGRKR
jgi:hypothetical protein